MKKKFDFIYSTNFKLLSKIKQNSINVILQKLLLYSYVRWWPLRLLALGVKKPSYTSG